MKWKHIWAAALALFFLFILTACGNERIFSASPAETGESYSSNDFSSGNPATSEKALKLQADFDSFCSDLFHTEMESSSTLDLHYTLLHSENYGIDAGDASLGTYRLSELITNHHDLHDLRKKLNDFDPGSLSADQQILYDSLSAMTDTSLMAEGLGALRTAVAPHHRSRRSSRSCCRSILSILSRMSKTISLCFPSSTPITVIFFSLSSKNLMPDSVCPTLRSTGSSIL